MTQKRLQPSCVADVNPGQQPDCNRCGEQLSGWLLCAVPWTNLVENPTMMGFFQKPDCSQSQLPRQLHPSASSTLQVNSSPCAPPFFWSEKEHWKALLPGSTAFQIHFWCRTDLFGVAKKHVRLLEGEVCAIIIIIINRLSVPVGRNMFLKIQLTFKHSISQLRGGHQWVFTTGSLPALSRR